MEEFQEVLINLVLNNILEGVEELLRGVEEVVFIISVIRKIF